MANIFNQHYSKCAFSMLKYHVTSYGKFYKFEIVSGCHMSATSPPDKNHKCDFIGPPHPVSNLRPIHFFIPENEASIEKQLRLKRQEVQQWNQDFWITHNTNFVKDRQAFITSNEPKDSETPLSAEEMSVFYKAFLDKNWRTHLNYNFEWYKKNAQIVLLHIIVKMFKVQQLLYRSKETKSAQST